jgi:hypothetical protein
VRTHGGIRPLGLNYVELHRVDRAEPRLAVGVDHEHVDLRLGLRCPHHRQRALRAAERQAAYSGHHVVQALPWADRRWRQLVAEAEERRCGPPAAAPRAPLLRPKRPECRATESNRQPFKTFRSGPKHFGQTRQKMRPQMAAVAQREVTIRQAKWC